MFRLPIAKANFVVAVGEVASFSESATTELEVSAFLCLEAHKVGPVRYLALVGHSLSRVIVIRVSVAYCVRVILRMVRRVECMMAFLRVAIRVSTRCVSKLSFRRVSI